MYAIKFKGKAPLFISAIGEQGDVQSGTDSINKAMLFDSNKDAERFIKEQFPLNLSNVLGIVNVDNLDKGLGDGNHIKTKFDESALGIVEMAKLKDYLDTAFSDDLQIHINNTINDIKRLEFEVWDVLHYLAFRCGKMSASEGYRLASMLRDITTKRQQAKRELAIAESAQSLTPYEDARKMDDIFDRKEYLPRTELGARLFLNGIKPVDKK